MADEPTPDILRAALRDCYDPDLPCNLVDLGLIRLIDLQPDPTAPGSGIPGVPPRYSVTVGFTPSNTSEATEAHLAALIRNRLAGIEALSRISVQLLATPPWTPAEITPAGRKLLGLDGHPHLIQIR